MIRPAASRGRGAAPLPTTSGSSISRRRGVAPHGKPTAHRIIKWIVSAVILVAICTILYGLQHVTKSSVVKSNTSRKGRVSRSEARVVLSKVKAEFESRYGRFSSQLMEKGLKEYGSIEATAARMVEASLAGRPFVIAFSGYSVTVGRGNYFNQSFPFEFQRILNEPMQQLLGIPLVVRNAAIGGIPSFPYSFCLEHFVGSDPDVLSWDYSMNEGSSEVGLEAFLRQAMQQLSKQPMIIMLDKNKRRSKLLEQYADLGLIKDAISVGRKEDVLNQGDLEKLRPVPSGFKDWDQFGAPDTCPGRSAWHPKLQEHRMIGWIIAMHFLRVLDRAYELVQQAPVVESTKVLNLQTRQAAFPKPLSKMPDNDPEVNELLFGHPRGDDEFVIKDLSCRTSFVPATDETKTLASVVVSGFAEPDLDIMIDRTEAHYKEGWVLDVSMVERITKRKVEKCGGLGYIDMKIAMYGIPESGKLRLWLPFEGPSHDDHSHSQKEAASHWIDDLLVCEANEKRPDTACKLHQDLHIEVGGVEVTSIHEVKGAAEYLGRKTCVNVGIPKRAKTTKLGEVTTVNGQPLSYQDKVKLAGGNDEAIGVLVDISAKQGVSLDGGACCLSHIVWEMH